MEPPLGTPRAASKSFDAPTPKSGEFAQAPGEFAGSQADLTGPQETPAPAARRNRSHSTSSEAPACTERVGQLEKVEKGPSTSSSSSCGKEIVAEPAADEEDDPASTKPIVYVEHGS
jgi:hypothetical protein